METTEHDTLQQYKHIGELVKKNIHLLNEGNPEDIDLRSLVAFNNRLVISESKLFLEAIKNDLGGEIVEDDTIGTYLYYGDEPM